MQIEDQRGKFGKEEQCKCKSGKEYDRELGVVVRCSVCDCRWVVQEIVQMHLECNRGLRVCRRA